MPSIHEWVRCRTNDGQALPIEKCNRYRSYKGLDPLLGPEPLEAEPQPLPRKILPPPPLWRRVISFAKAAVQHVAAGRPRASDELIIERLAICQTCEQFVNQHCQVCGCQCIAGQAFFNKLAWADQECPHPDGPKWNAVRCDVTADIAS